MGFGVGSPATSDFWFSLGELERLGAQKGFCDQERWNDLLNRVLPSGDGERAGRSGPPLLSERGEKADRRSYGSLFWTYCVQVCLLPTAPSLALLMISIAGG